MSSDETADKVEVWVKLGSTLVLLGVTTYFKIRAMLAADGVSESDMARGDAEYERRIQLAREQQQL